MSPPAFRFCPLCGAPLAPLPAEHRDAGRPACPSGHFVHYDNPAVTTQAFVEDAAGRLLVLRRAHEPQAGAWDLPGGFIESGEHPEDALRREIREETGLEVEMLELLGANTSDYGGRPTVDVAYRCRVTGGELALSEEKSEAAWLALDEVPELAFASENLVLARLRASRR
jgi:ADP-ribose pyrophosphatase YjhB (NUDIX family)